MIGTHQTRLSGQHAPALPCRSDGPTLAQLDLFHAARSASNSGALVMRFANEPETLSTAIPLRE